MDIDREIAEKIGVEGNPSTSLEQAFQVVSRMAEKGWNFGLDIHVSSFWEAEFFCETGGIHEAEGKTPALAICLAALKAVGADEVK